MCHSEINLFWGDVELHDKRRRRRRTHPNYKNATLASDLNSLDDVWDDGFATADSYYAVIIDEIFLPKAQKLEFIFYFYLLMISREEHI